MLVGRGPAGTYSILAKQTSKLYNAVPSQRTSSADQRLLEYHVEHLSHDGAASGNVKVSELNLVVGPATFHSRDKYSTETRDGP